MLPNMNNAMNATKFELELTGLEMAINSLKSALPQEELTELFRLTRIVEEVSFISLKRANTRLEAKRASLISQAQTLIRS